MSHAKYRKVPLTDLIIDKAYQRVLDETAVQNIVDDFNPALLGALEVSQRNGKAAVFDGQHRLAALKKLKASSAPCLVHEGLSVPEEAMLFVKLQTQRKPLRPLDRFKARLAAGEQQAKTIELVVADAGYKIGESGSNVDYIGAISALDRVYARGGRDLLVATLDLISVYKGEPRGTDGALIEGVAIAHQKYSDNPKWIGVRLALEDITAASLLRKAIASLEMGGGSASRPHAVAKQVALLVGIRGPYKKKAAA